MKNTNERLISKFREIHGDKYDYSFVENSGYKSPVRVICPKHGDFFISPYSHITMRKGCPECEKEDEGNRGLDNFIKKAKEVHGDKYDYSLVDYVNSQTRVKIICPEHGVFEQRPVKHLRGCGCYLCGIRRSSSELILFCRDSFEDRARKVHGDKYDYSLVDYKRADIPVKIICPKHGEFEQLPYNHLQGCGCPKCGFELRWGKDFESRKASFIEKANKIYKNKYDYSQAEYVNNYTLVKIICPEHGEFFRKPDEHLKGSGCPKCPARTKELLFLEKAKEVYGDKYDYSSTKYVDSRTPVKVICPKHGEFTKNPDIFLRGFGCHECYKDSCREGVIAKAREIHGDRYNYDRYVYKNYKSLIEIECPKHGVFLQSPASHLNGSNCPACANEEKNALSAEKRELNFLDKAHKVHSDKYDYSLVEYINDNTPVRIVCPEHGIFEQRPKDHLQGVGCPKCSYHRISKGEQEVYDFVRGFCPDAEQSKKGAFGKNQFEIDIWVPSKNIGIEYDGVYYHSIFVNSKYNISDKQDMADSAGVRLVNVFEDEWQNKRDITESRLKSILGVQEEKIFARKCSIAQITNREARAFLDANHLQGGNAACTFAAGLFYEKELVSVMTFCRPRMGIGNGRQSPGSYELLKFASRINLNVVGGASRLLKYFIKNTPDASLIYSFADRRWSDGGLYERLGFERVGASKPDYFYIVGGRRYHRFNFRKSVLVAQGFDPSKSEREIMEEREIPRVYDAGNYKYLLKI